ncbi:2-oxo acid dehydrogenase subunit E2 [Nostocoides sp. F2B08]|uniref:dihydrolipoamide acetyltransferase family protein n=1 Tax=Nostocoides sp. F2B08 TaxID=2653936 RepID=UPI001263C97B|nr:dihydrolipoamide acetyltransferase family protein [Tetrasphaera sp. F2B08]KAB7744139.1 2-oxo acid dehydrogenase subunit E2 [Tetrasphaera sp. F2B08]
MAELLLVPEVAAGATEVVISEWLVQPGQEFTAGEPLAVIETEKAVVEVEAETSATLLKVLVSGGSQIDVGSPMALLGTSEEVGLDLESLLAGLGASAPDQTSAPPRREVPEPDAAPTERRFISPIARKRLRDAGLTPDGITGTGPNGRIVRRDVETAIATAGSASAGADDVPPHRRNADQPDQQHAAPATEVADWTDVPHTRLRRAVATRLTQSKQEIPHFYLRRSAAIDELLALRTQLNEHAPAKISVNDFIIRAVAVAHREVPEANVIWTDEAMRRFDSVDISVAIASERGLVTPVLRGVESRSLSAISASVKAFVEQADAGRLQQKDLEGGSISVTNLGMFGVEEFSAIINPPQSAILAVGAGTPTPCVVDGAVIAVTTVKLVLSVDHRAIDGALAARWMAALVTVLENPLRLVL